MDNPKEPNPLASTSPAKQLRKYGGLPSIHKPKDGQIPNMGRSISASSAIISASGTQDLDFPFSSIDIEAKPLQEVGFLREPVQTLPELEQEIIAKNPPGQWFRKDPNRETDITCLPAELHIEILKNVTFLDQLSCERVCTTWRTIIRRDCTSFRYIPVNTPIGVEVKGNEELKRQLFQKTTPLPQTIPAYKKPTILIHRMLLDGNFAFRQIPGSSRAEVMSTYFPDCPNSQPRRFKIANLTFLNDPLAIYDNTAFKRRRDVPSITIEFDAEPLRNEFQLRIGGDFTTANTVRPIAPILPRLFSNFHAPTPAPTYTSIPVNLGTTNIRVAMARNLKYLRGWDLGSFLLCILGKLEGPHHWYENSAIERNERWNGRQWDKKRSTGVDYDGDWDMDSGFCQPLTLQEIAKKEHELLGQYQKNGFWYMRNLKAKNPTPDEVFVALTPVSEWIWEICY
ncbi:hypothetical protein H072_1839 [Dactylellina haptotyla CBS 200.50]|uniref:F-box domain-containing protein n=1 Tax=Dactylellina haptotyla (strain CBS 200.50) TaxID=1284197 RepID=S8AMG8_DACHA|nr:hypothetical protein H072_1839 [Dactylellina haptotyla CBS 200.50]